MPYQSAGRNSFAGSSSSISSGSSKCAIRFQFAMTNVSSTSSCSERCSLRPSGERLRAVLQPRHRVRVRQHLLLKIGEQVAVRVAAQRGDLLVADPDQLGDAHMVGEAVVAAFHLKEPQDGQLAQRGLQLEAAEEHGHHAAPRSHQVWRVSHGLEHIQDAHALACALDAIVELAQFWRVRRFDRRDGGHQRGSRSIIR